MYEVYPADHPHAGRRRFRRVALSLRKGSAKTELAAWIAAAELHPDAPVRCDGFDDHGQPIGVGVTDPYIPLVAYTEEQTEDLAYGALKAILELSRVADDFDIGYERILRRYGDGKAVALSSAPDARDGARTTFQHFDETHRFDLPRLKQAHRTMLANLPKRQIADPWSLETTTAYAPGEDSVAEDTTAYARSIEEGKKDDPRLFYFHRQAGDAHDLSTREGLRAAVIEASGPVAGWSDIDGIVEQFDDPKADRAYLERVWLNRPVSASTQAFDRERWTELKRLDYSIKDKALITLGFDGSRTRDSTALVATEVATGFQMLVGLWENPGQADWEVPGDEVDAAIDEAFRRWRIWRMYADPFWWESWLAHWRGKYGDKVVIEWPTNKIKQMAYALQAFRNAIQDGALSHDGNESLARHIGNACRQDTNFTDEDGNKLWVVRKERPDSPFKIDAAVAACLSWEARNDAVAAGAANEGVPRVRYVTV